MDINRHQSLGGGRGERRPRMKADFVTFYNSEKVTNPVNTSVSTTWKGHVGHVLGAELQDNGVTGINNDHCGREAKS